VQWAPGDAPQLALGVLAGFGSVPPPASPGPPPPRPAPLLLASPLDACGPLPPSDGGAYLIIRGGCSFLAKAQAVRAAGGGAALIYDDDPGCISMGVDAADAEAAAALNTSTSAVSLPHSVGLQLRQLLEAGGAAGGGPLVTLALLPPSRALDPAALLLWLLAVGTLAGGSLWAGADHAAARRAEAAAAAASLPGAPPPPAAGGQPEVLDVSVRSAAAFIALASAMLLLAFFFLSRVFVHLLVGLFALASIPAAAAALLPALERAVAPRHRHRTLALPLLGDTPALGVAATAAATAAAITWAACRRAGWAWALQDALGVCLMLSILRTLRLPSLRVATVLLGLALCYDVFFVFLQPALFGGGRSVMVTVATGGGGGEALPMLLRVPRLAQAWRGGYSMLGYGDVVLPGLLAAYARRVDLDAAAGAGGWLAGYFGPVVVAYGAGLALTFLALARSWFGDQGQPALLYLVPATLGTALALAWRRGQLRALMAHADGGHAGGGHADKASEDGGGGRGAAGGAAAGERERRRVS